MAIDVAQWLRELGLGQYAISFVENDVDASLLSELTADDLIAIGVSSVGHRRRLLSAIAKLAKPLVKETALTAPAPSGEAERRQLTVLFCDVVDSTALSARLDPEDFRAIIAAYHGAVAEVVARFAGFVAKFMGDGVLAYFGYPAAHEEDAERAVRSALAIIDAVARLDLAERLAVRIGIATGLVVVGDLIGAGAAQEQSVVGETPNLAARLQSLAGPDEVIIAEATRQLIGGLFEVRDLGRQPLRGFADGQQVWQVLAESGIASRFEALRSATTPLVGREEEVELLLRRWTQAAAGEGRVVLISAEPGIGKSRLVEALEERIAEVPHTRLRYFSSPHHQDSALYPVIAQLERAAGFAPGEPATVRQQKLAALFPDEPADELSLIFELLSLPLSAGQDELELTPQRRKERTIEALLHGLERLCHAKPVLMVFEDLHWIDPTSRELLDYLIGRIERLPVLLVATFRPEFEVPWSGLPHVTLMAVNRLSRRDGKTLIERLLGNSALSDELLDEIIERSDGVPLFLEEVTKVVIESDTASGIAAGGVLAAIPGGGVSVPPTLHASLLARLDRLGSAAKDIAQVGAAIGRDFSHELVSAAASLGDGDLQAALARLAGAGLVFQRGTPPNAEYQFKHALVRDTAYATLLRGPRQAIHARIAAAIESRTPDRVLREPEILAYHLTEAGQPEKAVGYWLAAGRLAAVRSATTEAVAHLRRGIDAAGKSPDTPEQARKELELQLALGAALLSTRGFQAPEANAAYRRARELAEGLIDDRARFAALWGVWLSAGSSYGAGGPRDQIVTELFRVSEHLDDAGLRLQAYHCGWATRMWRGELAVSEEYAREGLALYQREAHRDHALLYGGHDPAVCALGQGALAQWLLGFPERAAASIGDAMALAETLPHLPSLGHALWFAGVAHLAWRDASWTKAYGDRLISVGSENRLAQYCAIGKILHGWARSILGELEAGLAELREALSEYEHVAKVQLSFFNAVLGDAEVRAGYHKRGAEALAAAEARALEVTETCWLPEIYRLKGLVALCGVSPDPLAAEQCYDAALALAREQGARSLELRAIMSLARLWRDQGHGAKGHDLLAQSYAAFTEGFMTPDLIEAEVLLSELR